jgi:DNA processing protein
MSRLLILHLSLIKGIGPSIVMRLLKHPAFNELYDCNTEQIVKYYQITCKAAEHVAAGLKDRFALDYELQLIERHKVKWVTVIDDAYPPLLREIEYPPLVLYYRGANLHSFTKNIAIIGSRKAAGYAEQVVEACVPPLVQSGWSIVSGGAIGADTMAHKQTLARGGRTVAILGSGLLHPYPHCNKKMFEMIVENGGSVVSSFSLDTNPHPGNFPARNRIIAGMSQACLVVQAAERSGASITANFALNQGKQVLAVPGSIFDPLSAGCHALIKEGATPILSALDLLQELGEAPLALDKSVQMNIADALVPKSSTVENIPKSRDVSVALPENASVEERILFHCREPLSPEDLLAYIELDMQLLQDHLFDLQLAGRLEQNAVGLWQSIS